jgi:flagella basal body P-ring formation protein FlgA
MNPTLLNAMLRSAAALTSLGLALGIAAADAPAATESWTLRPQAVAGTAGVFLADIVDTGTNGPALPALRITNAPVVGHSLVVTRGLVEGVMRQRLPAAALPHWAGAAEATVARRTRALEESEVLERLTAAMQKSYVGDKGELELVATRPWVPPVIADEPGTLRIVEFPVSGLSASFIVRFELKAGRELLGSWQLPLQARVWRDLYVAPSALSRGTSLAEAGWLRERRDALAVRDAIASLPPDASGYELGEPLSPGSVLTARMIRQRPVVTRGHLIDALVQDGGLSISVRAMALEDGVPGQVIRIRNPRSQKEFNGKVQNADTVLVTL